jgi:DNA topoisomerase-1
VQSKSFLAKCSGKPANVEGATIPMANKSKKSLIIVESPAKMKTLQKFLGRDFIFESSVGHIRDLPKNEFGIDLEGDFEPKYVIMPEKKEVIKKLIKAAKEADTVYLCPDPDREGEAIAWHIASILPPATKMMRATFHSITKQAVQEAIDNPREIDMAMVNAQQARRLLDRMVGYKISPILNRRIPRGSREGGALSAGRVQSVALKLVVDREREIDNFKPVEYWNIGALLEPKNSHSSFMASLYSVDGKRVEKELVDGKDFFLVSNEETATAIVRELERSSYKVERVEKKEKKRNPVPPFITSTLQQEASRHYGFSSSRTMQIAQSLYEGVDMGSEGTEGLITYMRTDSVRIAPEAITAVRSFIQETYGKDYLPDSPRVYTTKKSAQDAHEAIRPTNLVHTPERVREFLTPEQFKLYLLVWRRFVSSQMSHAVYDTVSADVSAGSRLLLRVTGSVIKFRGFLAVYEEKSDEENQEDGERELPKLEEGQPLKLLQVSSEQAFTRPPPRFSEASLVRELEKSGIGRPSTYAAIMQKIQSRDYTSREGGRLIPTELGKIIAQMLETSFSEVMDVNFTAAMEDDLELVAADEKNWKDILRTFWTGFSPTLERAEKEAHVPKQMTDIDCPTCGKKLQKVWAGSKYFYGCSAYPECSYTISIEEHSFDRGDYSPDFDWDQPCPICSGGMKVRHGRFGAFLGCLKYPECKGIINIPKKGEQVVSYDNLPSCPAIGCEGKIVARKSRFGKTFFSCSEFPNCDVIVNDIEQLAEKYPDHPKTAYVKKEKKGAKGAKGAKAKAGAKGTKAKAGAKKKVAGEKSTAEKKPRNFPVSDLTPELAAIVGAKELPRTQVIAKVWDYIKEHNLQDAKDKRIIVPDAKLAKIFGSKEPVQMFHMTKLLSAHILPRK